MPGRPDGALSKYARLEAMLFRDGGLLTAIQSRHFAASLLALIGLAFVGWSRERGRFERLAAVWFLASIAGFLFSQSYYDQYNASLAPSSALLAGIAVAGLSHLVSRFRPAPALAAIATFAVVLLPLARLPRTIDEGEPRQFDLRTLAADIRERVPSNACIVPFEPARLLAADRLPAVGPRQKFAVDSYGAALLEQMDRRSREYTSAGQAFLAQPVSTSISNALRSCQFAVPVGGIARRVLTPAQLRWLRSAYRPVDGSTDLWRRVRK